MFFDKKEGGDEERYLQYKSLIEGWLKSPLIGSGVGAVASYVRSDEQPWSYELYFISILFQQGIIGFFMYFILFSLISY
jgi:hypothetical protein